MQNRSECGFVEAASRRHGIITSKPPLARLRALYALMRFRTWALRTLNHAKPRQARFCWGRSTAPRYNDLGYCRLRVVPDECFRIGDDRMGRRFAAAWWAALCAVLVCLCATAPPVRQAEYPPWDGEPYFDAGPDRVDVNTAPAAELETLPGIGEKKALAIVEYREANGPFRAVEELERVKGISERTVDGMRAYVRIS